MLAGTMRSLWGMHVYVDIWIRHVEERPISANKTCLGQNFPYHIEL